MYSLLLDSSNKTLSVGIAKDNQLLSSTSYEAWQKQSEYMVDEINKLLSSLNLSPFDIQEIAVAIGPGSYTGVRIALTIAKIYAYSLKIPLYSLSSLHILMNGERKSICLINARSNRSYVGIFHGEKVILEDCILNNDEVISLIKDNEGASLNGDLSYLGLSGDNANTLENMIELKKHKEPIANIHALRPVYLKEKL